MTEDDRIIIYTMKKYGGSFARALAEAADYADQDNLRRLREAFPDFWERYRDLSHYK